LFCCNDRLAEAVIAHCRDREIEPPRIVGFDDAPVAEQLNLTTIAIPWAEMIACAADLIKQHLGGSRTASRQLIFTPRPVMRRL
jgi:DNA-binding LacI/PurR family transcriptional regulator